MNDYQTLTNYINTLLPTAVLGTGESSRDLGAYFDEKLANPSNDKSDVRVMAKRALEVAGLDANRLSTNVSTLDLPANALKRACAATLLAMSVIRDTKRSDLETNYKRLSKMTTAAVQLELLSILRKGDVVTSQRFPKLEFKNFTSAGTRATTWKFAAEEAFRRTHEILGNCERQFLVGQNRLAGNIGTAFRDYFGDPAATIDTSTIPFQADKPGKTAKPTWTPVTQSHQTVATEVMRRVCRNFVNQNVRMYFGGKSIDSGTSAYVSGKTNPTKIHLGGEFFSKGTRGLGSMAGTIIHECTHAFARTDDHKYKSDACKALALTNVGKALSNADSYRFFAEAAFG